MSEHLQREIANLKKKILSLSALVEESVWRAVKSVETRDTALAAGVIESDLAIDHLEVDVEEDCLKILALHQPVAFDLRFIVSVLKINSDLERVGDKAASIASRVIALATQDTQHVQFEFRKMAGTSQSMLRRSLDALVNLDAERARQVLADEPEVNEMNREMARQIVAAMRQRPADVELLLNYFNVSRHLERIADLASNIAEDVIYLTAGEIVRHKSESEAPPADSEPATV